MPGFKNGSLAVLSIKVTVLNGVFMGHQEGYCHLIDVGKGLFYFLS